MRYAVLDLGTNTFHLLIAERNKTDWRVIYKTNCPVKLGENLTKADIIIPTAFERGLQCLIDFKAKIDAYGVNHVQAVATSAVRSAHNGQAFINEVYTKTGLKITPINGEEEARYIYQGVKASGAIAAPSLIMDMGGGSTEFILCDETHIFWKQSFDIGAARLLQKFFHSDPLNQSDQLAIENHLAAQLKVLKMQIDTHKPSVLIGSAGAFETFAQMTNPSFELETPHAFIDIPTYHTLANKLIEATHAQRSKMERLIALRVDMIVMAAIQTNLVLQMGNFEKMMVSTYDLKMGVLHSL